MDRVRGIIGCEEAYQQRIYGKGVGIAVLDSGVARHVDLRGRVVAFRDYVHGRTKPYDDNSHGTHIAGIVCGSGRKSMGRYMGVAPESHIIVCKVLNDKGDGHIDNVIQAIEWVVEHAREYGIRILNISVGAESKEGDKEELLLLEAVEYAWSRGLVVTAAAGNNGPGQETVTTPGISPKIITVGAFEENQKQEYSGRGPTPFCVMKPEILAPGTDIISCCNGSSYQRMSGTSMATPVVSAAIALLLEKNPDMTPKDVKYCLYKTAKDSGYSKSIQGWGLLNVSAMMKYK
ncbi:MAG: S8 family peptidase [Lachnospiraceae bacterium]|nr:S8 family peptidase [Lachnospiraceae bacterium]